jgi:hypothetical protein
MTMSIQKPVMVVLKTEPAMSRVQLDLTVILHIGKHSNPSLWLKALGLLKVRRRALNIVTILVLKYNQQSKP